MSPNEDKVRILLWGRVLKFISLPVVAAFVLGVAISFEPSLSGSWAFWAGLVSVVAWLIATGACSIFLFIQTAKAMRRKVWRQVFASLVVLLFVLPVGAYLPVQAGDYIHFLVLYPRYSREIRASHLPNGRMEFDWGDTGFAGIANSQITLVFDPSDDLAKQLGDHNVPGDPRGEIRTKHLLGHFYVVTRWY